MRVTSGKSRVRESRLPGSVRAKPNGRATRTQPLIGGLIALLKAAGIGSGIAPEGANLNDAVLEFFVSSVKEAPGAEPLLGFGVSPNLAYRRILAAGCSAGNRARPGPYSFSRKGPGAYSVL